jgi:hypothetical protein
LSAVNNDASTFTIAEETGEALRKLELRGRALPHQPFTLEGTMRAEFTRYPGNPIATVQVFGAEEKDTSVSGMWKTKFLGNRTADGDTVTSTAFAVFTSGGAETQLGTAQEVADAADSIRMGGQLVTVTWGAVTRKGLLSGFQQKWTNANDVEWEMTFQWMSRGELEKPLGIKPSASVEDFAASLRDRLEKLEKDIFNNKVFQTLERWDTKMAKFTNTITDALDDIDATVSGVAFRIQSPITTAERALSAYETVKTQCQNIIDTVEQTPDEVVTRLRDIRIGLTAAALSLPSEVQQALPDFGDSLSVRAYTQPIKRQAREMKYHVANHASSLSASTHQTDLLATFVAPGNIDLRDVSSRFYGTPDGWRGLMSYNSLRSSRLRTGQMVLIPKQQTQQERQV